MDILYSEYKSITDLTMTVDEVELASNKEYLESITSQEYV